MGIVIDSPSAGLLLTAVSVIGFRLNRMPMRECAAVALAPAGLAIGAPWPLVAIPAVAAASMALTRRGEVLPQQIQGRGAVVLICCGCLVALPIALLAALPTAQENRTVLLAEDPGLVVTVLAVLVLAVVNATVEELLWREMLVVHLHDIGLPIACAIAIPALSFGLAHLGGLPGSLPGVLLAAALGALLGGVRLTRFGLGGCIAVHVAIDVVLFGVVAGHIVFVRG